LAKKSILNGKINSHYQTVKINDLKLFDIKKITDKNALLFLWVVSPMLPYGIDLMSSWGFEYSTIAFVWYKRKCNPGHYTMSECEICLVGKKGKIPKPKRNNIRQFLSEERGIHSKKPNEIRDRIALIFPNSKKIELFAREGHLGWDSWGNEVGFINGKENKEIMIKKRKGLLGLKLNKED